MSNEILWRGIISSFPKVNNSLQIGSVSSHCLQRENVGLGYFPCPTFSGLFDRRRHIHKIHLLYQPIRPSVFF
ncbi:MAG: hypothetical protein AAFQ98_22810, partial [Bacteroidota bacterium]